MGSTVCRTIQTIDPISLTILMTLVPHDHPVKAEVWVTNEDAGWVEVNQAVKIKIAAFPFNKYGMVKGHVETISPDAAELPDTREHVMPPSGFRTLIALDSPYLERDGKRFRVSAGMLVSAEVNLGSRTVMEYLLSPVQKVTHEGGGRCERPGDDVVARSKEEISLRRV